MSLSSGNRIIRNKWTILPMPAKVIATIHQLAAACKKYKGIIFMDKDENIINDDMTNGDDMCNTDNITLEIAGVSENNLEITGVSGGAAENTEETEIENRNNEHNIAQNTNSELNEVEHNQDRDYKQYDDDISIEDKIPEDIHVTINDMNTIQKERWAITCQPRHWGGNRRGN